MLTMCNAAFVVRGRGLDGEENPPDLSTPQYAAASAATSPEWPIFVGHVAISGGELPKTPLVRRSQNFPSTHSGE